MDTKDAEWQTQSKVNIERHGYCLENQPSPGRLMGTPITMPHAGAHPL